MDKKMFLLLASIIAFLAGIAGYAVIVGPDFLATTAEARSSTIPSNPHILYLIPQAISRGAVTSRSLETLGVESVPDWNSARSAGRARPLDALLIDSTAFDKMGDTDRQWMRQQLQDGVVLASLGAEDKVFATALGLSHLGTKNETKPIGATGYRLVFAIALGKPEDLKIYGDWIERSLNDDSSTPDGIKYPIISEFSQSRGALDTTTDLDQLFQRIHSSIEEAYKVRAEFQESLKTYKGN